MIKGEINKIKNLHFFVNYSWSFCAVKIIALHVNVIELLILYATHHMILSFVMKGRN